MYDPLFNEKQDSRVRVTKLVDVIQRAIMDHMNSTECDNDLSYHEMNAAFIYLLNRNTEHAIKAEIEKEI